MDFDAIKRRHGNWRAMFSASGETEKHHRLMVSVHKARAASLYATPEQKRESLTWLALKGSGPLPDGWSQ